MKVRLRIPFPAQDQKPIFVGLSLPKPSDNVNISSIFDSMHPDKLRTSASSIHVDFSTTIQSETVGISDGYGRWRNPSSASSLTVLSVALVDLLMVSSPVVVVDDCL